MRQHRTVDAHITGKDLICALVFIITALLLLREVEADATRFLLYYPLGSRFGETRRFVPPRWVERRVRLWPVRTQQQDSVGFNFQTLLGECLLRTRKIFRSNPRIGMALERQVHH